ncbi:transglycosylase SLT domain-containing protein [Limnobaculum sp. M2-1]|nr:transglycosylase SLT domain-containing protein [Limnobaculum sp. M2-1]
MAMKAVILLILLITACHPVLAAVPGDAARYKRDLTRVSHAQWGLDAPVATFAAQIHQESRWRSDARSPVGAVGLAQFMPATSKWIAGIYPSSLGNNQPYNPAWALQALVTYNHWHYQRIKADTDCDRWAFTLSAYNGGLGWVQRDQKKAASQGIDSGQYWGAVEFINAGRSAANFKENRSYPDRIIYRWQPEYQAAGWGNGVCN